MSDNNGSNLLSFMAGFLFGGLVGAVAALIMAPQSGEETRVIIRDKSIELKDMATSTATEISKASQEKATELQKRGQVILEEQKDRISQTKVGKLTVAEEIEEEDFIEKLPEEEISEDSAE